MTRANPLPPDERRNALIAATIPLLMEHGQSVSTRQIAQAAGVAEGTIFRVFASKDDLLDQALADAISADGVIETIESVDPQLPLEVAMTQIMAALRSEGQRTQALMAMISHPVMAEGKRCSFDLKERRRAVLLATSTALEPHADQLRVPPRTAAIVVLAIALASSHPMISDPTLADPEAMSHVLLHGFAKES